MKGFDKIEVSDIAKQGTYSIVYTSWNSQIINDLLQETKKELISQGVPDKNIILKEVPGAFELPLAAQKCAENSSSVIALGAIIKGDTPHFDFISSSCIGGLQDVALKTNKPIICGVLTTENLDQAKERSDPNQMNKGREFALSAMNMVDALS
jgi:6,7-dimethyl-8-ribityllumazine synthase|tara:strand:+ start:152 stop:610 length:459 start_codon:yes stop_codon:yes gene_type:complete